jgi:cyclic beta-1,2-glucan synthetase
MAAVDQLLVRRDDSLALLFTPPFERTSLDPGYIKGYPPGIRENGGQYTHAAAWSVIAFATDAYSVFPHVGRDGSTWYTGSAGWLYRAGIEWILGFRVQGEFLLLDPRNPKAWPRFEIVFRLNPSSNEASAPSAQTPTAKSAMAATPTRSVRARAASGPSNCPMPSTADARLKTSA